MTGSTDPTVETPPSGDRWRAGGLLALLAVLGTGLLAGTFELTRERIAEQERAATLARLGEVLDPARYDNDLVADTIVVRARDVLGHDGPMLVYRARKDGRPAAVVMEVTAPDGYNGDIVFLLGVDRDGTVTGARVTRHRETPGLGDPIEARRSDWILAFTGRSLGDPEPDRWTVRKDGGAFDQFTGATITPRAVARAMGAALALHAREGEGWFEEDSTQ